MSYETFDHKHEFAGLLRNITASLSWNQSILSKHMGVSRQLVGTYCSGMALPAARIMEKLLILFHEYSVDPALIQEIFRHYVAGMFPESAQTIVREYLWNTVSSFPEEEPPESIMLRHLSINKEDSVKDFFKYLIDVTGCDCCCIYRHSGSCYELREHYHFAGNEAIRNELEETGKEHFSRWFHILDGGNILELEIGKDLSPLQCRSTRFHNRCFVFLAGIRPKGLPAEAAALIYINHHPAYISEKRKLIENAVLLWQMHRERCRE